MKQDIQLECVDCKSEFEWTAGEQKFIEQLQKEGKIKEVTKPKRCLACRNSRKLSKQR